MKFYNNIVTVRFSTRNHGVPNVRIAIFIYVKRSEFLYGPEYLYLIWVILLILGKDVSKSVRLVRKISNYKIGLLLLLKRIKLKYGFSMCVYTYNINIYGFRFKTGYLSVRVCSINIIIII